MIESRHARLMAGALVAGTLVALVPSMLAGTSVGFGSGLTLGWGALPLLFGAGVLTSLTPCVYPLIPITVSIFGAGRSRSGRGRAAALSATYVLGIAAMYSALGLAAAASGRAFGSFMGNPWVVGSFAVMLLVFAASMFGAFDIQLPASLQTRLAGVAGLGFGSAFVMGLVAGVIAAPCTGPALAGVLTFVAQTRDLWLGFWMLFSYALGMGLLFFVVGTFSVRLPKSGPWMDAVKSVLGIALVVVAISFVKPFLPRALPAAVNSTTLALVAGVLVVLAVLVGAIHRSFHGGAGEKLFKGLGVGLVVFALALRFEWVLEPNAQALPVSGDGVVTASAVPAKIAWIYSEEEALRIAKEQNKPVLIDFYADWCTACVELDKYTFSDARVRELVSREFVALKIDGTDDTDEVLALQNKYGVVGLPLVTVVSPDGRQLPDPKIAGFLNANAMLKELAKVSVQ